MAAAEQAAPAGRAAHPVATHAGVARDTAANQPIRKDPDALAVTALRTKSVHAREVLAELAWRGHTQADVDAWAASGNRTVPPDADAFQLGQLGRILALQRQDEQDLARSRRLLEALVAAGAVDELPQHAVQVLLQLRGLDGDARGCAELMDHPAVLREVAAGVRADLANPFLRPGADAGEGSPVPATELRSWLGLLDDALHSEELAPLRLTPERGETPFDQLHTDPLPRADEPGEGTVTVVVSAYRPGPPLLTAVRSLVEQTWHDLEILVVDDASGPEAEPWLQRAEAMDPRVRVLRKAVNGGTYRCRNTALRQARGRWFTTLDSDDWLHPEAVATLVRALEERPWLVAVRALGARVTEDLRITKLGYRHRAVAAPTLLFRTSDVFTRLGFFDPARKSADTEYARRILLCYGTGSIRTIDECLLLLRSGETLSSSEFSRMWRHGARHAYKNLYGTWHADIRAGASPYLDPQTRPVVEPRRWDKARDPLLPPPRHLDLVLGGDWRRYGGPQRSMMEEIRAARAAGLRVGILHLEALRFSTVQDLPLCRPVLDLVRSGEVQWVQLDDDVEVDVLMIRYPLLLQHPPFLASGRTLRPRHLLVMANQAPVEPDGSDQRYVVREVTERARELFGAEPVWVPQGPVVREVLRSQDPDVALTDWDNPGLIDLAEWQVRPDRVPGADGAPVVVGRYSRDDALKFPRSLEELLTAYTFGAGYLVRMMGAARSWRRLTEEAGLEQPVPLPAGWELVPYRSVDPRELLAGLDFVVYQDNPDRHEAFGRVLLESAASGALVIAHPKHRRVFGQLLDYAEPGEVRELVEAYAADPDRYRARVQLARRLVAERYSHESFVGRLRTLPGVAEQWDARRRRRGDRGRPWRGEAALHVAATGDPRSPVGATVRVKSGNGLAVHHTPLRSAADAGRADQLVLVHAAELSTATRDRLREALAVPAEADVDDAVRTALAASDDLAAVLLCRDGVVELAPGPAVAVDGSESWVLVGGPQEVRLVGGSTGG